MRTSGSGRSANAQKRTFIDIGLEYDNLGAVTFLVDFSAFMAIGLLSDRVAFSEMRRAASSVWPFECTTYKATLFPRILPLPVGAALSAYARGPDVNALNLIGLGLMVAPVLLLCVAIIRQWYAARPRR
jgi:purine-cytosine permease-like protein